MKGNQKIIEASFKNLFIYGELTIPPRAKNVLKKKGDNVEFDGVKEIHAHAAI